MLLVNTQYLQCTLVLLNILNFCGRRIIGCIHCGSWKGDGNQQNCACWPLPWGGGGGSRLHTAVQYATFTPSAAHNVYWY